MSMCSLRGHLYLETHKYMYIDNNGCVLKKFALCGKLTARAQT